MFAKLVVLALVALAVCEACDTTGYKKLNEACSCSDKCLGNSYCQKDGLGGTTCQCLLCDYFDEELNQCVKTPDYGEPCTSVCKGDFVCTADASGCKTCGCPAGSNFNNGVCETIDNCLIPSANACTGRDDGDYPLCFPSCQAGRYATCSNEIYFLRDCALGFYQRPEQVAMALRLVFNPDTSTCEGTSEDCPRELDPFFIG